MENEKIDFIPDATTPGQSQNFRYNAAGSNRKGRSGAANATPGESQSQSLGNPRLLVLGALGNGKSTVLNALAGIPETFETSKKPKSCTQEAKTVEVSTYTTRLALTDTPGLFDLAMPLPIWLSRYGAMSSAQKKVSKVLWVIRGVERPDD